MKITCIAIDDEPLALSLIESYCKQISFLDFKGAFLNPIEALDFMSTEKIDLIYLDIRMPDLSGFQFLNALTEKPLVVLTTAYNQYGPESYEFDIADYLLKPISIEKFLKASNRAKDLFEERLKKNLNAQVELKDEYLFVKADYKLIKIKLLDILYIEGLKDYIKIYVQHMDRPILTIMRIKTFEENLPSTDFIRVHRSFLVNTNKIDFIQKSMIYIGQSEIPVGGMYSEAFFKFIDDKNWK
jgi:DNA-binding LytR/AlgR family response regulator